MQQSPRFTDRLNVQTDQPRESHPDTPHARHAFHKPHTALGGIAHWVKTAGILAPLLIGEFVKDPDKCWRWIRISAVAAALVSEGLWTNKVRHERERARECE